MRKYSIIIPAYNAEEFLHISVDSVISQTHDNWEVIIINDGSTDSTLNVCQKYARKYDKIKVVSQTNAGAGLARSKGLASAYGDYVIFLDADDYLKADYLENVDKLLTNDIDIAICDYYSIYSNQESEGKYEALNLHEGTYSRDEIKRIIMPLALGKNGNIAEESRLTRALWNYVFSMDLIKSNNLSFYSERVYFSEDLLFLLDSLTYANRVKYMVVAGYTHVYQTSSLSSNSTYINWDSMESLYDKEYEWCELNGMLDELPRVQYMYLINVWGAIKRIVASSKEASEIIQKIDLLHKTKFITLVGSKSEHLSLKDKIFVFLLKHKLYSLLYYIVKKCSEGKL